MDTHHEVANPQFVTVFQLGQANPLAVDPRSRETEQIDHPATLSGGNQAGVNAPYSRALQTNLTARRPGQDGQHSVHRPPDVVPAGPQEFQRNQGLLKAPASHGVESAEKWL